MLWYVKIAQDDDQGILVGNYIDEALRSVKIMNGQQFPNAEPEIIIPDLISDSRTKDLEFFNDYVTEDDKPFISKQY